MGPVDSVVPVGPVDSVVPVGPVDSVVPVGPVEPATANLASTLDRRAESSLMAVINGATSSEYRSPYIPSQPTETVSGK